MEILVLHGKHGDYYYDASTPEALAESAFKVLKMHYDQGYYFEPDEPLPREILSDDEIVAIESEELRNYAKRQQINYKRHLAQYEIEKEEWDAIVDTVENERKEKAWAILDNRSDAEYESVSIERVEEA